MKYPIPQPDGSTVIELEARTVVCTASECGGKVVRHSLGAGQSVDRCTRCFRRYQTSAALEEAVERRSRLRRMFDEFVTWRE
jgi:ribonuclease PH